MILIPLLYQKFLINLFLLKIINKITFKKYKLITQQENCIRGRKFNGSLRACAIQQVGAEHPDVLPHEHDTVEGRGMTPCFDVVIPPKPLFLEQHNSLSVFFCCAPRVPCSWWRFWRIPLALPIVVSKLDACL